MDFSCSMILLLVLIFIPSSYGFSPKNVNLQKGTEMFNCISIIVCEVKKPLELQRMKNKAGPRMQAKAMEWLTELYHFADAEDTDEFWINYSEVVCVHSEKQRREVVKEFMTRVGKFYEEVCQKKPDVEECKKMDDAMAECDLVIAEYTQKQICNNPQKMGKGATEGMKGPPMMG